MKAKRFTLMLLVMLMSVGAWAQERTKLHLTRIKSEAPYEWNGSKDAIDENPGTYWDVIVAEGQDTYVEFMADSPVRVDEYRLIQYIPNTTSWEIKASEGELDDAGWNTADVISVKSDILENQRSNLFATEMSSDSRYQYFRLYLKNTEPVYHYLSEIEFYVTCAHDYDSEMVCSKCGYKYIHYHDFSTGDCSCGMPHPHLFDGDGVCTVENCGYDAKKLAGFITEVDNESIFGGSQSTNKNEICNLFDGNTGTKWQPTTGDWKEFHTVTAVFQTLQPVVVNGYSFYCEKRSGWGWMDSNDCVPKSWNLYGYNMTSQSWVLLDAIEDNAASPNCYNSYRFRNEEGQSYQYFKWEVTNTDYSGAIPPYQIQIGEFTLDAQDVQHAHRYSEDWYSDDNGHWRQCLNEFGECDAPINDFTAHTHTIYAAVCDVCGHKNTHEHEWDDTVICRLCGIPHSHQFDGNGNCTVSGCGYSVSDTDGFLSGVNETIGGSTPSGDFMNLFDGDNDTKWSASPTAVAIFKTQTPARINGYSFTSSHPHVLTSDNKKSHPKSWKLYGLSEANTWVELHSVTDAFVGEGWNNYRFVNNDGPKYSYFKLEVTDIYLDYFLDGYLNMGEFSVDVHNHNYEWMSDESEHWLECTNEEGKCNIKKKSEGTHTYDDTAEQGSEPYYICSICGHIDPVRQHIHDYSEEWSSDGTHHWHKCTSTLGTCVEPREGETTHSYHESILCDTENYMCDVCQYVDEEKKAQFGADRDYLSMKAVGGDVRIGFKNQGTPDSYTIQVSEDGNHWSEPMELSATVSEVTTIPEGQTRYFRYGSTYAITSLNSSSRQAWRFTMAGEGTIEAGGNIMSLLDRTCLVTSAGDYAFSTLFYNCTNLTKAPKLPATTLGASCYSNLFGGCSNLKEVELPMVESFGTSCFSNWLAGTASDDNGKLIVPIVLIGNSTISLPNNWSMATRIKLNEDPDNSGNFYTTFYDSRYEYAVAEGHKAYTGSIEGDELHLAATPDNIIPKGDGVLIHGGSGEVLLTVSNTSTDIIKENVLTGSNTDTTAPANCYILSYGQNGLGFYKYAAGKTLSAHKAYLVYEKPGAKGLRMVFADDEADGIENINDNDSLRYDNIYSLSGVRLDKLQKGINIVGGKKIVVK